MLELSAVTGGYGSSQVLHGVDLEVGEGEMVALLGRNGMGKTTTVRTIMGLAPVWSGRVRFAGADLAPLPSFRIARAGIGLVPEGRQIFPNLTLRENLEVAARPRPDRRPGFDLAGILALFPTLAERLSHMGSQLSGGEQQMLAIGRALMTNPALLVLDEATEGLAPRVRESIWGAMRRLREDGLAILVIDQDLAALQALADRHYILEKGVVAWTGTGAELAADPDLAGRHLGV